MLGEKEKPRLAPVSGDSEVMIRNYHVPRAELEHAKTLNLLVRKRRRKKEEERMEKEGRDMLEEEGVN